MRTENTEWTPCHSLPRAFHSSYVILENLWVLLFHHFLICKTFLCLGSCKNEMGSMLDQLTGWDTESRQPLAFILLSLLEIAVLLSHRHQYCLHTVSLQMRKTQIPTILAFRSWSTRIPSLRSAWVIVQDPTWKQTSKKSLKLHVPCFGWFVYIAFVFEMRSCYLAQTGPLSLASASSTLGTQLCAPTIQFAFCVFIRSFKILPLHIFRISQIT